jgi:hypothetical protein
VQNLERLQAAELDVTFLRTSFENADDLACIDIAAEPLVIVAIYASAESAAVHSTGSTHRCAPRVLSST